MEISCKFRYFNWYPYYGTEEQYSCCVVDKNITSPIKPIKTIVGVHEEGKGNEDVIGIWFYKTNLQRFPRHLHKLFPNLLYLSIFGCDMKKISRRDFKGLESLVFVEIRKCKFTSLPDDLLADLPSLRSIYFNEHEIEFASSKLLEPFAGRTDVGVKLLKNTNIDAKYLPNDAGSLESMNELMKIIDEKCKKPINPHQPDSFDEIVRELWTSGRFSDFTIVAGMKAFKVHKNILVVRSSVFAKIIEDYDKASEIELDDFTSNAVEALLLFIYTGDIKEGDEGDAMESFKIANKFKVTKMKSAYEEILADEINEENAFEIFMLAHQHSADELKKVAFRFVASALQTELPKKMMEDPEKLKKVVVAYREYQKLLKD